MSTGSQSYLPLETCFLSTGAKDSLLTLTYKSVERMSVRLERGERTLSIACNTSISCQSYDAHNNFFALGGLKTDFGGHDICHHDSVYAYTNQGFHIGTTQLKGHNDQFYSNYVVLNKDGDYGTGQVCTGDGKLILHDDQIYTPNGTVKDVLRSKLNVTRMASSCSRYHLGCRTPACCTVSN